MSAAERGKTHTILSCVSASGYVLPPMMVYPRRTCVPEKFKKDAFPNTLFGNSESGWINSQLFIDWFAFFIDHQLGLFSCCKMDIVHTCSANKEARKEEGFEPQMKMSALIIHHSSFFVSRMAFSFLFSLLF